MTEMMNLSGMKFGRLTALSFSHVDRHRKVLWLCICDCGGHKIVMTRSLRSGKTVSCGCFQKESHFKTHGFAPRTRERRSEYRIWSLMRDRCRNPNNKRWDDYGGRGIRVCERWNDFTAFLADVGPRPSLAYSLDRYPDNDGNYEPGNVRWATAVQQANNKRNSKKKGSQDENRIC